MNEGHVEKIESRGFWRINFQPLAYSKVITSVGGCLEVVSNNAVYLRGWKYPHVPNRNDGDTGIVPCSHYYQAWVDWQNHKEFWRMYQSGQFLHYLALREDWFEEDKWHGEETRDIKPGTVLSVTGTIYQLTEIFLFLERLAADGIYDSGLDVNISLVNTKGRRLWITEVSRGEFLDPKETGSERIDYTESFEINHIIGNSKQLTMNAIVFFFDRFGWHNPSLDVIRKDQEDFLGQRL